MSDKKLVLFDLDGTLVDNFRAIYNCTSYCCKKLGIDVPSYEDVVGAVGGSILVTMSKLFDEEYVEPIAKIYLDNFYQYIYDGLTLMPHTVEILSYLRENNYKIALFTNKEELAAKEILNRLGIFPYFNSITGTTLHSPRKPDLEFTLSALNKLSIDPKDALIIGDSLYDYNSSQNAKVDCLLVTTGTVSREVLEETALNAKGIYANFKELAKGYFATDL